jgi:2-hydroxychromene-2-carboxylate isomerase
MTVISYVGRLYLNYFIDPIDTMTLQARIRSTMMGVLSSEGFAKWQRGKASYLRHFRVEAPRVYYFHQVDDPYSHLAVQKLAALKAQYDIGFVVHLVRETEAVFKGDAGKFDTWARRDASAIANYFNTEFKPNHEPTQDEILVANGLLANIATHPDFAERAIEIGEKLWSGRLANQQPVMSAAQLNKGTQLRNRLGHYLGGMFYFEGEWFWSLDRLHLLERRLQEEGYGSGALVCPLPTVSDFISNSPSADAPSVVLEYFPSLRSPYTAIGHRRVLDLVEKTGVNFVVRPVMPMMMRGVPAPFRKQRYIMSDSGREARYYGDPFGPFSDPFGEPVKRAFAAYHHAETKNLGLPFITEYLKASFAEGLNIRETEGLTEVCRRVGFDYADVDPNADWMRALETNLSIMADASLWGVPSFRVTGGNDETPFACWGQDRIWRIAAEIKLRTEGSAL